MSEHMKSGEIRKGESLHFDGTGFTTRPVVSQETHFKVNKWMRKQGFIWELESPVKGFWVEPDGDNDPITQDEAVVMYNQRKRWWQIFQQSNHRRN